MICDILLDSIVEDKRIKLAPYNNMISISNQNFRIIIFPSSLGEYISIIDSLLHDCNAAMKLLTRKGADKDFNIMSSFDLKVYEEGRNK